MRTALFLCTGALIPLHGEYDLLIKVPLRWATWRITWSAILRTEHMIARQASLWATSMPGRNLQVVGNKPRGSLSECPWKMLLISLFRDLPILVCVLSTCAYQVFNSKLTVSYWLDPPSKSTRAAVLWQACLHSMVENVHVFARDAGNVTQAGSLPYWVWACHLWSILGTQSFVDIKWWSQTIPCGNIKVEYCSKFSLVSKMSLIIMRHCRGAVMCLLYSSLWGHAFYRALDWLSINYWHSYFKLPETMRFSMIKLLCYFHIIGRRYRMTSNLFSLATFSQTLLCQRILCTVRFFYCWWM